MRASEQKIKLLLFQYKHNNVRLGVSHVLCIPKNVIERNCVCARVQCSSSHSTRMHGRPLNLLTALEIYSDVLDVSVRHGCADKAHAHSD